MSEQLGLLDRTYLERDRLLAFFEKNHSQYVESLRAFAIATCRYVGTITIDDLRDVMAERNYPLPHEIGADNRLLGTVLSRCKEFECVGSVLSRRPERIGKSGKNSSYVSVYRLKEKGVA